MQVFFKKKLKFRQLDKRPWPKDKIFKKKFA